MRDSIDFQREMGRFTGVEVGYIVDILQGVYKTLEAVDQLNGDKISDATTLFGEFISAIDECDVIEIVDED